MKRKLLLVICILLAPLTAAAEPADIQRVEPPNWWTGFRETGLQLMVYGNQISMYQPSVDYHGVTVGRFEKGDSPDYLFVYLDIAPETEPGTFEIAFSYNGLTLTHPYELKSKNPDPAWARGFDTSDAIYLITPDRFANGDPDNDNIEGMGDPADRGDPDGRHGGDIQGIIDSLNYIRGMGFTAIWLNPLLENAMPEVSYHGYSTTDFYAVDPRYGSNELYRDMVAKARSTGLGVIMDMIVNHIGSAHWWMDDLPTKDWLNFQGDPKITSHEHITEQDPYASAYDTRMYSDGWFVDSMPDLNQRNPLLADYLTQNALWWIEYLGLSGIRMDTWPYPDKHYMTEWTRRVMLEYPNFNVVGEEWTDNPAAVARRTEPRRLHFLSAQPDGFPPAERFALGAGDGRRQQNGGPATGRPDLPVPRAGQRLRLCRPKCAGHLPRQPRYEPDLLATRRRLRSVAHGHGLRSDDARRPANLLRHRDPDEKPRHRSPRHDPQRLSGRLGRRCPQCHYWPGPERARRRGPGLPAPCDS